MDLRRSIILALVVAVLMTFTLAGVVLGAHGGDEFCSRNDIADELFALFGYC